MIQKQGYETSFETFLDWANFLIRDFSDIDRDGDSDVFRATRTSAAATDTISALELLMPDARGRSLAKTIVAPAEGPGKLRWRRRTTVAT